MIWVSFSLQGQHLRLLSWACLPRIRHKKVSLEGFGPYFYAGLTS